MEKVESVEIRSGMPSRRIMKPLSAPTMTPTTKQRANPLAIPPGLLETSAYDATAVVRLIRGPTDRSMPPIKMTARLAYRNQGEWRDLEEQVSQVTLRQKITGLAGSVASKQNDETEQQADAAVAT